jgi:hypothetical protein
MRAVDLALLLAVDASSSVDYEEFGLMMGGYASAFRDQAVQAAALSGPNGAIAIALLLWSGRGATAIGLPWTLLENTESAGALADAIEACPRLVPPGATALGEGMAAGLAQLATCPAPATRGVMDVSGDGAHNQGRPPGPVRDVGVGAGYTINALAVVNEEPDLLAHYRAEVIGGPGSFAMECPDYAAFADAIRRKLLREIGRTGLIA